MAQLVRALIVCYALLAAGCFLIALIGLDPFIVRALAVLLSPLLLPTSIFMVWAALSQHASQTTTARYCAVLLPLFIISILWTYWPFRITFLLHKREFDQMIQKVQAGETLDLPRRVGIFEIHRVDQAWFSNIGLHVRGASGTHFVHGKPVTPKVWYNTNWEISLGDDWYYVYED